MCATKILDVCVRPTRIRREPCGRRDSMAHLTGQRLKITWYQTTDMIELAFAIPAAEGEQPEEREATDESLTLVWAPINFQANFYKPMRGVSARWKVTGRGKIEVQLRKGQGQAGGWKQPFETSLPYLFKNVFGPAVELGTFCNPQSPIPLHACSDARPPRPPRSAVVQWNKWDPDADVDLDAPARATPKATDVDDKILQQTADVAKALGGMPMPSGVKPADELEQEMAVRFCDAAPLYLDSSGGDTPQPVDASDAASPATEPTSAGSVDVTDSTSAGGTGGGKEYAYAWLRDWDTFRIEQRMVTMASFWNEMDASTRHSAALRLVAILKEGDASLNQLESGIKGGNISALKLDTSVYKAVARPARWNETFARMIAAEQVTVMELCFTALPFDEKKVVVATFM